MASVGVGRVDGVRECFSVAQMTDIYICVCETKVEQKKSGIFMLFFRMYIVFFYFLPFHLYFYISLILGQVRNEFLKL